MVLGTRIHGFFIDCTSSPSLGRPLKALSLPLKALSLFLKLKLKTLVAELDTIPNEDIFLVNFLLMNELNVYSCSWLWLRPLGDVASPLSILEKN